MGATYPSQGFFEIHLIWAQTAWLVASSIAPAYGIAISQNSGYVRKVSKNPLVALASKGEKRLKNVHRVGYCGSRNDGDLAS